MRIGICGAGPAGLYFAILAKRADARHEITVVERNPAGATYGWGVVFSEETLSELRDADYEAFVAIDEALVRWSAIDVGYRDRRVRSRGHGFSAISRMRLLGVLQERALAVGCELRFSEEVDPVEAFDGFDLIVAADGANSTTRTRLAEHLHPTLAPHSSKYVWFGTDLVFEVFTFVFRETEHGLFTVHAYPFDAQTSTFIVECAEDTWRRAGLDRAGEEDTLGFCQELFADHLGHHKLLGNRSLWSTFVTVRNRSWHHGNLVLLGDAAHTAHFSIGSGTKLAMEDSIALAKAFVAHPSDLDAAFAEYESERQPVVERFQEAATDSSRYFENVRRYLHLDLEPFAFNLLTRSGRITRAGLELRDPVTTNRVDRWHAGEATGDEAVALRLPAPPPGLGALRLAGATVPNRVALAPAPLDDSRDGIVGPSTAAALVEAARAGAGLVLTEPVAVSAEGRITPGSPGLYADAHVEAWSALVERVRGAGPGLLAVRLSHAGRRGAARPRARGVDLPLPPAAAWPVVAPSPLAYRSGHPVPRELDAAGLAAVRKAFTAAAVRAASAGIDALLLDCADGYLLASFLSPLSNHRGDGYGGDLHARLAFPLEVAQAVRAVWPRDRILGVRLLCDDRTTGGVTAAEGIEAARAFAERGFDLVGVAAGFTTGSDAAAADYRRLYQAALGDEVRNEARVRVLFGGAITTLDQVHTLVGAGRADLCVLDPTGYAAEGAHVKSGLGCLAMDPGQQAQT